MKKLYVVVLAAALFFGIGSSVLAEGAGVYHLQEAGITVTIPDGFSVVTRDTPADDPAFGLLGGTRVTVMQTLIASGAYLYAFPEGNTYGIQVVMQPGAGNTGSQSEPVFTVQRGETNGIATVQYSAVAQGKTVGIVLKSNGGPVTQVMEDTLKAIADSVKFDTPAKSNLKLYVLIGGSVILAAVAAVIALTLIQSRKSKGETAETEGEEKGTEGEEKETEKKAKSWWGE
ncbi:MAG: hypothetical protein FWC62_06295 [Firmicutes bacterium]|nr:hypothetical protein [Bacillota bacterium]